MKDSGDLGVVFGETTIFTILFFFSVDSVTLELQLGCFARLNEFLLVEFI